MKRILILLTLLLLTSCGLQKSPVDFIVYNATIYTVDSTFSTAEAMAIKRGRIVRTGSNEQIRGAFKADSIYNAQNRTIFPGFIDAHAHFYGYGTNLQSADLKGLKSWEATLEALKKFGSRNTDGWLIGRGWDQNLWIDKEFPNKEQLDILFPERPVYITRVDGHAALVNQKALDLAGISQQTSVQGGTVGVINGVLSGILIDNAMGLVESKIPAADRSQMERILRDAEKYSIREGLTSVVDAGLDYPIVEVIQGMHEKGDLKIRLNVMLSDNMRNVEWLSEKGIIKTDRLQVRGFKFYGDGALGSRGACLLRPYSDKPEESGFLLSDIVHFEKMAKLLSERGFQMNTHAIGDSTNRAILEVYANVLKGKNDLRWRIEHAQVVEPSDIRYFKEYSIIPSVQPTHATSDMYWAEDRLGPERIKNAYAYKNLLEQNGLIALGTDFPVEEISPLRTYYAAVVRKDAKGYPQEGFQSENALSREQAIRGMTIWAAFASFEENEKGSLEKGKLADFIILDNDIFTQEQSSILNTKILRTYIGGQRVHSIE